MCRACWTIAVAILFCIALACVAYLLLWERPAVRAHSGTALPLAVLGDSDSHSYHDRIGFGTVGPLRGGAYRDITFQWTEALASLRGAEVDLGQWGKWGRPWYVQAIRHRLGRSGRSPRREDYLYNFAYSGARCESLNERPQQVDSFLFVAAQDKEYWQRGVVIIRIGINNFGMDDSLERLSKDPLDPAVRAEMAWCVGQIAMAVQRIKEAIPEVAVMVVGIFDNSNWPPLLERWQSAMEIANIQQGLDYFDNSLRTVLTGWRRVAFFDERAWFRATWGGRNDSGEPAYRTQRIGCALEVQNTSGDSLDNAVLSDGHAGVVWNVLWVQALVAQLRASFGLTITPLADAEIEYWLSSLISTWRARVDTVESGVLDSPVQVTDAGSVRSCMPSGEDSP